MPTFNVEKYSGLTETKYISCSAGAAFVGGASILSRALSAPSIGSELAMPTDSTPGIKRARSVASCIKRARSDGAVYRVGGNLVVAVKTSRGSYPSGGDYTRRKLRNNKPRPTSS